MKVHQTELIISLVGLLSRPRVSDRHIVRIVGVKFAGDGVFKVVRPGGGLVVDHDRKQEGAKYRKPELDDVGLCGAEAQPVNRVAQDSAAARWRRCV